MFSQKMFHLLQSSSYGRPNSATWPSDRTRMRSQSIIVWRRWAMVSTVQSRNFSLICSWMSASVRGSTLAVASSRTSTLFLLRTARARHRSCRCPTDRLEPEKIQMREIKNEIIYNLLHSFQWTALLSNLSLRLQDVLLPRLSKGKHRHALRRGPCFFSRFQ